MPRMLDDRLPGIEAKRREIEGWPAMAKAQGWYEPDDEVDAHLPYLNRDLGWDDKNWRATEHSFSLLLDRYVRPGMRVLEVGAAKAWASQHLVPLGCEYVATDILADPVIGLGRGAFYEERVGAFGRVQADGEHLPFASEAFDVTYCVAALHHALDLTAMVREMARVTRKGGWVCALNEGTRALGAAARRPRPGGGEGLTASTSTCTRSTRTSGRSRARASSCGASSRRRGTRSSRGRRIAGRLLRLPGVGRSAATFFSQTCHGYSGVSLYARKGRP